MSNQREFVVVNYCGFNRGWFHSVAFPCCVVLCSSFFAGCAGPKAIPPLGKPAAAEVVPKDPQNIPSVLPVLEPSKGQALYSLRTESSSVEQVLKSLAQSAGLQLDLSSKPKGLLSLDLVDRPLREVLDAILPVCDCDYRLAGTRLQVFADTPVSRSYAIDYLNINRSLDAQLSIATRVGNLSVASDRGSGGGNTSSSEIKSQSQLDVWLSIDKGLRGLLQVKADDPRVQVNSAAGLVIVHAKRKQQDEAAEYLARLQSRVLRQVSIEAQVIEIELNENHAAGVDWSEIAQSEGFSWLQSMSSGFSQAASQSGSVLQYTGSDSASNTRVLVTLLEEYGDVRVISAPRVVALNNQPSVLSVVENKVYFSSSVKRKSSSDESTVTESVETAIHTVPVGLVMQVTPQVAVGGDVVMSIRPTISRVSGYVNDPNPSLAAAGVVSRIPEIQVRELETVLRVRGGETVVLGGMMQLRNSLDRQNVPWLHKLPAIGSLFRSRQKAMHQAELLVLLTPTVMSPGERR